MVHSLGRKGFAAAAVLSLIAGYIDGFGYIFLGGYFVSFMSGNTTRASVDLAGGALGAAALAGMLILAFVSGAALGTLVPGDRIRGETRVLVLVTALTGLAAAGAWLDWRGVTGVALAAAMGAMNTVFARGADVRFGITYMTGALMKLAQSLVAAVQTQRRWEWVRPFVLWASIAIGATLGALGFAQLGNYAIVLPALIMAVLLAAPSLRSWLHV